MNQLARQWIQGAVIETIKKKNGVTYGEIAESIGVHPTHIQKVSKCVRLMSEEKLRMLCERWSINLAEIENQMNFDDAEHLRWKTLTMLIKARKVDFEFLSHKTGISILDFNQVERGKRQFTQEEVQTIAGVLDVDAQIVEEGSLALICEMIEKGLQYIHFQPSAIEAILKFIEVEI
jgi:transcriptional regulator with XRE-family HTH domain